MNNNLQNSERKRRGRKITGRFFVFVTVIFLIATGMFLLYKAFPPPLSRAADADEAVQSEQLQGPVLLHDGYRIVVDAGHGDTDPGTIGVSTGRLEKEVNLEIALKLKTVLEDKGYLVVMTRDSDEPIAAQNESDIKIRKEADMAKRGEIIQNADADAFVSIHQNYFEQGSGAQGPQVFCKERETSGYDLAQCVQTTLNENLDIQHPRGVNTGDYQLLRFGEQASIIVECGFFSNPEEEQKLQKDDYQQEIAEAIADGIEVYFFEKSRKEGNAQQLIS